VLTKHTPDEIINTELHFIDKIGLREHLSPTRSNGLVAMVKQMKMYALAFKAKNSNQSTVISCLSLFNIESAEFQK